MSSSSTYPSNSKRAKVASGESSAMIESSTLPYQQQQHQDQSLQQPIPSGSGSTTDFNSLNDAIGISGVDIAAEEEIARQQRIRSLRTQQHPSINWPSPRDRDKVLDFLERAPLTSMVQQIAASYQLKTLEPAILDVLSQAAEHRLHAIIVDSIVAKQHRVSSSHLRPPPLYPPPKSSSSSSPRKGKEKAQQAMYDQTIYDQPESILSILARVEGEEERRARISRNAEDASTDPTTPASTDPDSQSIPVSKPIKKEKKRKREGPGQQARNMSEDARARMSNQTAMRSVGGRGPKYSWLSGGGPPSVPLNISSKSTLVPAHLPAPKFAPHSISSTNNATKEPPTKPATKISAPHQAVAETGTVGIRDCLFALERERGQGVGKGSGSRVLFKSYIKKENWSC